MLIGLALLFFVGVVFSEFAKKIGLPHFLGLIFAGIIVSNFLTPDFYAVSGDLKNIALVILMTRVSFNLKVNELVEIGPKAIYLSMVPAICEVVVLSLLMHFVLDYSMTSTLVMASVIAASSPAISVPMMLKVKQDGYGTKKRIPQLLVASCGVDNAFIIVLFHTLLGFESTGGFRFIGLINIPIAFALGAAAGAAMYYFEIFLIKKLNLTGVIRIMMTLSGSFFLLGLEDVLENVVPYSGIIAILIVGVLLLYKEEVLAHELSISYKNIWSFVEVLLFGIVGASIDFSSLGQYLILGIVVSLVAMCVRIGSMFIALAKTKFTAKEKLFCGYTLSAKATVQASLGGIPLAMGLPYGELILAVSVISIFVTSPLAAIIIDKTYKTHLSKDN